MLSGILLAIFAVSLVAAQQSVADTTIYDAPDQQAYPLLKNCNPEIHTGWNADSARTCGEYNLMRMIARNMAYPAAAREANLQGTVVTQLLVEPDGRISKMNVLKDIGGGCAQEAIRILRTLDSLGLRWQPAMVQNKTVRSYKVLPFRFRLTEEAPYTITATGDSVYYRIDTAPEFKNGIDSLYNFILSELVYPKSYRDSCKVGVIELSLLIRANGTVNVENQIDFNNLGFDFQFNAIQLANRTRGKWLPATYEKQEVSTTTPFRVLFQSDAPGCKVANERFDQAMVIANEAVILSETDSTDAGIKKMTAALALQPDNTELLYYRGTMLLNRQENEAACEDYNRIKAILGRTWFEDIRRLVCGW